MIILAILQWTESNKISRDANGKYIFGFIWTKQMAKKMFKETASFMIKPQVHYFAWLPISHFNSNQKLPFFLLIRKPRLNLRYRQTLKMFLCAAVCLAVHSSAPNFQILGLGHYSNKQFHSFLSTSSFSHNKFYHPPYHIIGLNVVRNANTLKKLLFICIYKSSPAFKN